MGVSPLSLLLNGFAAVVHTTTPWPRPTPAGVATARGGESPRAWNGAQREWKAPWSAQTERSAVRKTGDTLAGASGQSPLARFFAVAVRQGQALRTGHRSARGVAQDAPFFTAARLERRAGALTETERSYKNEYDFLARNALPKSKNASLTAHFRQPILGCISAAKNTPCCR